MLRFTVVLLALAALAYGVELAKLEPTGRIVGGDPAAISSVPWQLSLRRSNSHYCSATLISPTWALTAADCTIRESLSTLSLLAGTANRLSDGQTRAVAEVISHPNHDTRTNDYDISLLRVDIAFDLGTNVQPVELPAQGAGVAYGAYGILSGWGSLEDGSLEATTDLQQIWLPVIDHTSCKISYSRYSRAITDNMLCAGFMFGGRDACQGDSGSPFVINDQLVGLVSWGIGCGVRNFPGVYTRVPVYRDWIRGITGV